MSSLSKRSAIIAVALLPILAIGYFVFFSKDGNFTEPVAQIDSSSTAIPSSQPVPVPASAQVPVATAKDPSAPLAASVYADGTFTATGSYVSPGGADALDVTVTLKDNVITDVSIVEKPGDPASKMWQDKFASGYRAQVVGKKLADLKLTNVSGSSLTRIGFNDALDQIRIQAKAV